MKKCPYCAGELVHTAIACEHCGRELGKPVPAASATSTIDTPTSSNVAAWAILVLVIIAVLSWYLRG